VRLTGRAPPRRLRLAASSAILALLAGCALTGGPAQGGIPLTGSSSIPAARGGQGPSTLQWVSCARGRQCATLQVPLDYSHPGGRLVPLALTRRPASGQRIGSLLLNPGGPGESGIDDMGLFTSILDPSILARFDLVTFDPRGVGQSDGVQCLDGPALDRYFDVDLAPTTAAGIDDVVTEARIMADGCASHSGDILAYIGTGNSARDMDRIRLALGDSTINYLGFSYGTLLGSTYADLYPSHVGRMVLDGAIDPALTGVQLADAQSVGFEQALSAFLNDCARSSRCAWKPAGDIHAAFTAVMARLRAHPLAVGARSVGAGEAFLAVAAQLYSSDGWTSLGGILAAASAGNGAPMLASFDAYVGRQADGSYKPTLQANIAIDCMDQPWPSDPAAYPALAAQAAITSPDFGAANIFTSLPCALWPSTASGHPHAVAARGSPPIVVVGSTGDPATPYAWAVSLSKELQQGVLLTRVGEGHTGYEHSACIRAAVDGFLIGGKPPAKGSRCPI
jgi:pimeloyl-ACP methyl ester carboxylesterase